MESVFGASAASCICWRQQAAAELMRLGLASDCGSSHTRNDQCTCCEQRRAVCWTDLTQVRSMRENFVRSGPRESAAQATPAHKSLLNPGSSQDPRSALGSHSALKPCLGNENGKRLSEDTWKGARPVCATFMATARCAALGSSGYTKPSSQRLTPCTPYADTRVPSASLLHLE